MRKQQDRAGTSRTTSGNIAVGLRAIAPVKPTTRAESNAKQTKSTISSGVVLSEHTRKGAYPAGHGAHAVWPALRVNVPGEH